MNGNVIAFSENMWWQVRIRLGVASFHWLNTQTLEAIGESGWVAAQTADGSIVVQGRTVLDGVRVTVRALFSLSGRVDFLVKDLSGKVIVEVHLTDADVAITLW